MREWNDNIKTSGRKGCEDMNWIHLFQDLDRSETSELFNETTGYYMPDGLKLQDVQFYVHHPLPT
jgi:hypothetical protein